MDNRSQFYIISAVMLCIGLLTISSYLRLDTAHVKGVSFEAENIKKLYEDVIAISITQDPTLEKNKLRDNLDNTTEFLENESYSRGYDIRVNLTGINSMFIHAEVKNITMVVTTIDANTSVVEIKNSGFGGDFSGYLFIDGNIAPIYIAENSTNINITSALPGANATLLDSYNYTVLTMPLSQSNTNSSVYILINGTLINPNPSLNINYSNGTSPLLLLNGTGYPSITHTNAIFDVNRSQQKINLTEIVNSTYGRKEPIIWIIQQTDLSGGRILADNAVNISMAAPVPIYTNATRCFASFSLYMSSCDTSLYKKFDVAKEYVR